MAPERLERNINHLKILSKAIKPQRESIINTASKDLILCICDCAYNCLNGNIPLTDKQIKQLVRYKKQIRRLANKDCNTLRENKEIILQNGGFLPLILTPVLSIAGSLLADLIRK
jgi:hypothetical protein